MKQTCSVMNKSHGRVIYLLPEENIRREFYPREVKHKISVAELEKLVQTPGGREIFYNHLFVNDPEVVRFLINGQEMPEYWLTEEQIPEWMATCSLEEFQDALDFAPEGVKGLIKAIAVSLPLNDYAKRQAIETQLHYNVTRAIEAQRETKNNEATVSNASNASAARRTNTTISIPPITKNTVVSMD